MKLYDILEGVGKKPKPRPKSNLWFRDPKYWARDLNMERGDVVFHEDEEENLYATDKDNNVCYGFWDNKRNGGMTFFKPRPFVHYTQNRKMIRRNI